MVRQNRLITAIAILSIIALTIWYFDLFHEPVESLPQLIGKNYEYAIEYIGSKPVMSTSFNIHGDLNELRGGILGKSSKLKDSIIQEHRWDFSGYKITIWTSRTAKSSNEIIDAIRYKNDVQF